MGDSDGGWWEEKPGKRREVEVGPWRRGWDQHPFGVEERWEMKKVKKKGWENQNQHAWWRWKGGQVEIVIEMVHEKKGKVCGAQLPCRPNVRENARRAPNKGWKNSPRCAWKAGAQNLGDNWQPSVGNPASLHPAPPAEGSHLRSSTHLP